MNVLIEERTSTIVTVHPGCDPTLSVRSEFVTSDIGQDVFITYICDGKVLQLKLTDAHADELIEKLVKDKKDRESR